MLTEEQHQLRMQGIGASEVGILAGCGFKSPLELYWEKTGLKPREDLSNNEVVIMGNLLEPIIIHRYEQITKNIVRTNIGTLVHPKYPYILASPDGLLEGKSKGLECKTVGLNALNKWRDESGELTIPQSYLLQCHQAMMVCDLQEYDLAVLVCGQELKIYTLKRDKEIDEIIIALCADFWLGHVEPRIAPSVAYHDPKALELLREKFPIANKEQVQLSLDIQEAAQRWESNKQLSRQYQKAADAEQALILSAMENNGIGLLPNGNKLVRKEIKRAAHEVKESSYISLSYKEAKK